jgi:hypothetical protein
VEAWKSGKYKYGEMEGLLEEEDVEEKIIEESIKSEREQREKVEER